MSNMLDRNHLWLCSHALIVLPLFKLFIVTEKYDYSLSLPKHFLCIQLSCHLQKPMF